MKRFLPVVFFVGLLIIGLCFLSSKIFAQNQPEQIAKVVCPSGTAGQGGCDYVGGEGIQKAVDEAPTGSSANKAKIIIKSGTYTRQNFTEVIGSAGKKRKCFVDTRQKYLIFEGEGYPVLNGEGSTNMSGFCAQGGEIEIKGLVIRGFKKDVDSCFANDSQNPCSRGFGVLLGKNVKATIIGNQITGNQSDGGIVLLDTSSATIVNNTISFNRGAGVNIYSCDDHNPSATVKNNIITNNRKNTDGTFGFGIGGDCLHHAGKLNNDVFAYNLIWRNEGDGTKCGGVELCENFTGRINANPQFVNSQAGDFRLKSTSPAIDAGDPSITDTDGSRSDMGAWGGRNPLPLVLNGSFEENWFGWKKNNVGTQEIRQESGRGKVLYEKNDNAGSRVIQWVPIQNRKFYKLTLDLKGGGMGGGPLAAAHEWCLGGRKGNKYIKGQRFDLVSIWTQRQWVFKAGNCEGNQDHHLAIFFDTNNNHKGEIWVDNVILSISVDETAPTNTPTPAPTITPACLTKTSGDANCDVSVNDGDYPIWRCEFLGNGQCSNPSSSLTADFNLNRKVDLVDFEIWRAKRFL